MKAAAKSTILTFVILTAILVGSMPMSFLLAADADFSGDYVMKGKGYGKGDRAYSGTCSITRQEKFYDVSCFNADTRHTYVGKGLSSGDQLAVFIGDELKGDHNRSYVGEYLVLYHRLPDGRLSGEWAHAGSAASGEETLSPKR